MKPKKKILTKDIIIGGIAIIMICVFAYAFYNRTQLILKKEQYTFEYGDKVDITHERFLELDKNESKKQDIIKNTKITSNIIMEDNKDYPKVGEYEISFTFNDNTKVVKVIINDTNCPTIMTPKSIEMFHNEEPKEDDLKDYFHSEDLSENSISFNFSQYDKTKIGEQTIKVIAKDVYNNQTTLDYVIKNIEKPDTHKYTTKTVVDKDDNGNVTKVYIKKIEKPFQLDVKLYCQHDVGARMGCDPAALYQAMKYKGYCKTISLRTFIEDMPISPNNNPETGFYGDPFVKKPLPYLSTIFPQPMSSWAKKYGNVANISGKNVDYIIDEIRNGNPVVVWVTYNFNAPKWEYGDYGKMYKNAHCFTVSGYNPQTKMIRLSDPGGSRNHRWVARSTFESSYNYKKFAVVVR